MGYWKDNFPGSAAYFQRIRIARGVVGYTLVVGGLLLAFSPFARTARKALEDGGGPPKDPAWIRDKLSRKWGANVLTGLSTREHLDVMLQFKDREAHTDFTRPKELRKGFSDFSLGTSTTTEDKKDAE